MDNNVDPTDPREVAKRRMQAHDPEDPRFAPDRPPDMPLPPNHEPNPAPDSPPQIPDLDPRLQEIKKRQMDAARNFRDNLGNYKQEQYTGALSGARNNMADRLMKTKNDFNRRGLLDSGARQVAEADEASGVMAGLVRERASISSDLDNSADAYDAQALKSELAINDAQADISRQLYDRAISDRMAKRGALEGLFGGVGSLIGGIAGKK